MTFLFGTKQIHGRGGGGGGQGLVFIPGAFFNPIWTLYRIVPGSYKLDL